MIYSSQAHAQGGKREAEYLEGWQRARAELQNYRKRVQAGQASRDEQARAAALAELLTIAEHFQAIVRHVPVELNNNSWVQGVLHVAREVEMLLESQGVVAVSEVNVPFNPSLHEAVEQVKYSAAQTGFVLEIIQPGYKLGDRVLKPARVKVSV